MKVSLNDLSFLLNENDSRDDLSAETEAWKVQILALTYVRTVEIFRKPDDTLQCLNEPETRNAQSNPVQVP